VPASASFDVENLQRALDAAVAGDLDPLVGLFAPDLEWRGPSYGHLWWRRAPS
jgi:ketosteroid isomerase-like protein